MKKGYPSEIYFVVVLVRVLLYENSYFEAKSKEKINNRTHPDCLKEVKKIVIGTDWFRNCEVGIISTLHFVLAIGKWIQRVWWIHYSELLNFPCHWLVICRTKRQNKQTNRACAVFDWNLLTHRSVNKIRYLTTFQQKTILVLRIFFFLLCPT